MKQSSSELARRVRPLGTDVVDLEKYMRTAHPGVYTYVQSTENWHSPRGPRKALFSARSRYGVVAEGG